MSQIEDARSRVAEIERAIIEGRTGEAALDLLERRRKRLATLRDSLTLTTSGNVTVATNDGVTKVPNDAATSAADATAKSPTNITTLVLPAPKYDEWFGSDDQKAEPFETFGRTIAGLNGFLVTVAEDLDMLDKLAGDGTVANDIKDPVPYLVYRRPVPAMVTVQPCLPHPDSETTCVADQAAGGAASAELPILVAQASGLYKLPIGRGGMFGSKEASAKFDEWGAPIELQYGSAPGAADIASTIDAAGEAATAIRDARVERIKRKIDLIEAQTKLDVLEGANSGD